MYKKQLLSCNLSISSIKAAALHASIIGGKYHGDELLSKWSDSLNGECTYCDFNPGSQIHWVSFWCLAFKTVLLDTFQHSLQYLESFPYLLEPVNLALEKSPEEWGGFLADPSTNEVVIRISQHYGRESIWPLFRLSRAMFWSMDRQRKRLLSDFR